MTPQLIPYSPPVIAIQPATDRHGRNCFVLITRGERSAVAVATWAEAVLLRNAVIEEMA